MRANNNSNNNRRNRNTVPQDDNNMTNNNDCCYDYDIASDYSQKDLIPTEINSSSGSSRHSCDDVDTNNNSHLEERVVKKNSLNDASSNNKIKNSRSNNSISNNSVAWNTTPTNDDSEIRREITLSELITYIGSEQQRILSNNNTTSISPNNSNNNIVLSTELDRRVRDFRLAQQKRWNKYGSAKKWGVFGMYNHLNTIRLDLEWTQDAAWRRQYNQPYLSWNDFDTKMVHSRKEKQLYCTYGIILICTIMLIMEFYINDWQMAPLSQNFMFGPSAESLIKSGARDTNLIVTQGQWYRIVSPLVLHAGIIHYLLNMVAISFIGAAIEQCHGPCRTLLLFIIPGVGGNILSAIFLPNYISVGASGGIFGLLGGCIADIILNWKLLFIRNISEEESNGTNNDDTNHNSNYAVFRRNFWSVFWLFLDILVNVVRIVIVCVFVIYNIYEYRRSLTFLLFIHSLFHIFSSHD